MTVGVTDAAVVDTAVGFVSALRRSGLEVSLVSSRLYIEALSVLDIRHSDPLYWAGRAALVHRITDVGIYNAVFGAYWLGTALSTPKPLMSVSVPVMLQTDDPETPVDSDDHDHDRASDVITVRYSNTETLARKDFAECSEAELDEARRLMARLRWQGPTRPSRRPQPSRSCRGHPDVRRTVRAALRAGGEPVRMLRKTPGRQPRRLVFLLDISGSMERYARALLRLVQSAVASRSRVEAFTLGTRLTRLTRELASRDPDRALQAASEAVPDWSGGTRLGAGLRIFNNEWGCRGIARGACVVILSDGWDRGDPNEMSEQMQRLARVAYQVVWVNPLKASPGYAPLARGMAAALPWVDDFVEGHNLESLERLAELILTEHRGNFHRQHSKHHETTSPASPSSMSSSTASPSAVSSTSKISASTSVRPAEPSSPALIPTVGPAVSAASALSAGSAVSAIGRNSQMKVGGYSEPVRHLRVSAASGANFR